MKKLLKFCAIAAVLAGLVSCANPGDEGNKGSELILKYNEWGTSFYSYYQTDLEVFSNKFDGTLSTDGKSLTYTWTGKSNRNVKNLYMIIADIEYYINSDNKKAERWNHLLCEEKRATPIKSDIQANKEFTVTGNIVLDKLPVSNSDHVIGVFLACGADDTDGPVHLYTSETENTAEYNAYMEATGNAIKSRGITIADADKGTLSISGNSISFTKLPKIKLSDGVTYDASKTEDKKVLLEKGYFMTHLYCDDFDGDYYLVIGTDITEADGNLIGNWGERKSDFGSYSFAGKLDNDSATHPIFAECNYFEYKDSDRNCYFPIKAFTNLKK